MRALINGILSGCAPCARREPFRRQSAEDHGRAQCTMARIHRL